MQFQKKSIQFKISLTKEAARNTSAMYNPTTIKKLRESYPYLKWLDLFNAILPTGFNVNENVEINNIDPKFFDQLSDVLNSTSKRTLANYVSWRAIYSITETLTANVRNAELLFNRDVDGKVKREERWKECVSETDSA